MATPFLADYKTTLHCKSLYYSSGFPCDFTVTMAELIPAGTETDVETNRAIAESTSTFSSKVHVYKKYASHHQ